MKTPQTAPTANGREPKIYEVHEFIRFKPSGDLIPVVHYRTVYHRDGRISKEALSVKALLPRIIRAFQGYPSESDGVLTGFFDDARDARECAHAIAIHYGKNAEISGTRITLAV